MLPDGSLLFVESLVYYEYPLIQAHIPLFFKLWSIQLILIATYLTMGRFIIEARNRARS